MPIVLEMLKNGAELLEKHVHPGSPDREEKEGLLGAGTAVRPSCKYRH